MAKNIEKAILSPYFKNKINEDIIIYEGNFSVYLDKIYKVNGSVYMKMGKQISINFTAKHFNINPNIDSYYYCDAFIEIYGYQVFSITIKTITKSKIKGYVSDNFIKSKNRVVDYVDFNIINLDKIPGSLIKYNDKVFAGRIKFEFNDYIITIDKRNDYNKELKERLKSTSGFLVTHIGRIQRKDKSKFKTNLVIDLIDRINYALTFFCARYVSISVVNGFSNDKNNFRLCIQNMVTEYKFVPCWTDTISNHNNIEKYISLMLKKLDDKYFDITLKKVIDWYVQSIDNTNIENNIISIQIALETLSYIILVQDLMVLTDEQFEDNTSYNNIKLTLEKCFIYDGKKGLSIFDENIKNRFNDGVELIIYLRNKVVHPSRKDNFINIHYEDIWNIIQVGSRYIELIILFSIGYKGEYSNRLNDRCFGEVEKVPWSKKL